DKQAAEAELSTLRAGQAEPVIGHITHGDVRKCLAGDHAECEIPTGGDAAEWEQNKAEARPLNPPPLRNEPVGAGPDYEKVDSLALAEKLFRIARGYNPEQVVDGESAVRRMAEEIRKEVVPTEPARRELHNTKSVVTGVASVENTH